MKTLLALLFCCGLAHSQNVTVFVLNDSSRDFDGRVELRAGGIVETWAGRKFPTMHGEYYWDIPSVGFPAHAFATFKYQSDSESLQLDCDQWIDDDLVAFVHVYEKDGEFGCELTQ